ncbi:hypothetical protein GCM10009672_00660 [Nesterenkonia lutea]
MSVLDRPQESFQERGAAWARTDHGDRAFLRLRRHGWWDLLLSWAVDWARPWAGRGPAHGRGRFLLRVLRGRFVSFLTEPLV